MRSSWCFGRAGARPSWIARGNKSQFIMGSDSCRAFRLPFPFGDCSYGNRMVSEEGLLPCPKGGHPGPCRGTEMAIEQGHISTSLPLAFVSRRCNRFSDCSILYVRDSRHHISRTASLLPVVFPPCSPRFPTNALCQFFNQDNYSLASGIGIFLVFWQ